MKLYNLLLEERETELSSEFQKLGKDIARELEDELTGQIDEAVGVISIVSYILASNTLINMISKFAKKIFKKYNIGKGEQAADKIYNITHTIEGYFIKPIEYIVSKFTKDKKKIRYISRVIFILVLLVLAAKAGSGAFKALKSKKMVSAVVNSSKTALKGKDIGHVAKDIAKK